MDDKFVMLKRYPGMRGLGDDVIRRIAADCEEIALQTGDLLYEPGQTLTCMYFVGQGRLEHRLEQLAIPVNTVTVDLVSGESLVRDRGDAVDGILESINLPGLSEPICRNGEALVDGGLVNNVPANVLVRNGCNFVIAVSVTASLEKEFANIRPELKQGRHKAPSVMQTIMRGYMVQNVNMNSVGVQPADEIIDVDVTAFDLSEFTRTDELAAVGARTMEASVGSLRHSLCQLDARLFAE